jgi:hypothetical protein
MALDNRAASLDMVRRPAEVPPMRRERSRRPKWLFDYLATSRLRLAPSLHDPVWNDTEAEKTFVAVRQKTAIICPINRHFLLMTKK